MEMSDVEVSILYYKYGCIVYSWREGHTHEHIVESPLGLLVFVDCYLAVGCRLIGAPDFAHECFEDLDLSVSYGQSEGMTWKIPSR